MYINCLKDICNGSLNDQVAQVCFVMIESLSHTTDDLIFKWNFTNPLYVSPEIQRPQVKYSKYHWGSQNGLISRHFVSFLTPFFPFSQPRNQCSAGVGAGEDRRLYDRVQHRNLHLLGRRLQDEKKPRHKIIVGL